MFSRQQQEKGYKNRDCCKMEISERRIKFFFHDYSDHPQGLKSGRRTGIPALFYVSLLSHYSAGEPLICGVILRLEIDFEGSKFLSPRRTNTGKERTTNLFLKTKNK